MARVNKKAANFKIGNVFINFLFMRNSFFIIIFFPVSSKKHIRKDIKKSIKKNMLLKQLQSNLSPTYINPSEKKEQRVSMYRLKKVYELNKIFVDKKVIKSVNNNEENSFFQNISENKIVITAEQPKPIPVNIEINLSNSLTNEYLANKEMLDLNLPVPKLTAKNTLLNISKQSIFLNKIKYSSSMISNFESKKSVKQNQNLKKKIIETQIKLPLENQLMQLKHLEDFVHIDDMTKVQNRIKTNNVEDIIKRSISDIILNNNNSSNNLGNNSSIETGKLFWTKLGKSANWPSIVVDVADINVTTNSKRRSSAIHVKFFNDSGRRAMVSEHQMIPYNGAMEFLKNVSNF